MADAGYDLYTLLDVLIDRVAWPSQSEQVAAHNSVQKYREVSLFGNMATLIACPHENVTRRYGGHGKCDDCQREVSV